MTLSWKEHYLNNRHAEMAAADIDLIKKLSEKKTTFNPSLL